MEKCLNILVTRINIFSKSLVPTYGAYKILLSASPHPLPPPLPSYPDHAPSSTNEVDYCKRNNFNTHPNVILIYNFKANDALET